MRLGLGLGIVKSAASIYKGILDKFPNAVAAYSTRKLKTSYPTTLPADYGGGAAAAYSLRKVKADYEGSAVKVRRSSDGGLQDIGFDSNGNLDTTALTTFVGSENLFFPSETFTGWGNIGGSTITSNTTDTNDPFGGSNATKVVAGSSVLIYKGAFTNVTRTQSFYAKAGTCETFGMYFGSGFSANFNISESSPSVTSTNNTSATITAVGNGWYRCTATLTSLPASDYYAGINFSPSSGSTFYIFGAQLEGGTTASTYNKTTTGIGGDGHVTRWYSQSDPVDTYTADFSGGVDGFVGSNNNSVARLESVTDIHGTTVNNVIELTCSNNTSSDHSARLNNPFGASNPISLKTLKCSFKMLVPSSNSKMLGATLSNGERTSAGIVSDGKVTEKGRWTTFTDVAWTQINQTRLTFMGLNDTLDDPVFGDASGEKFYIADVVLTETTDAYNGEGTKQPLIVEGGDVVTENGKAAIEFDGVDDYLTLPASIGTPFTGQGKAISSFSVSSIVSDNKTLWSITGTGNDDYYFSSHDGSKFKFFARGGGGTLKSSTSSSTFGAGQYLKSDILPEEAASVQNGDMYIDGTQEVTSFDYATASKTLDRGGGIGGLVRSSVSGNFNGKHQEIILFASDQSTNRKDIEWNINNHYSIYDQWDRKSCMNVRRSSDNATQDIGFSGKNINQTQLESFVNDASPVLDDYTGDDAAAAAYSLRKIRTAYDGFAINVRRSSDGGTKDIGFDANGDLDTTALENFCKEEHTIADEDFSTNPADNGWTYNTGATWSADVLPFVNSSSSSAAYKNFGAADSVGTKIRVSFTISNYSGSGEIRFIKHGASFTETGNAGGTPRGANGTYTEELTFSTYPLANLNWGLWTNSNFTGEIDDFQVVQITADGHVTTWYDQAGINNATAACSPSACEQPLIVEAGDVVLDNNKPAIKFDGVDDYFTGGAKTTMDNTAIFAVIKSDSNTQDAVFIQNTVDANNCVALGLGNLGTSNAIGSRLRVAGVNVDSVGDSTFTATDQTLVSYLADNTAGQMFVDGTEETDAVDSRSGGSNTTIGARGDGNTFFNGAIQEVIFFDSDQSGNRLSIEGNIGRYYNITGYRDGFVTKWYDQSGEYNHAENSTHDEQPQIVSNGSMLEENGKAAVEFDGSDDGMQTAAINTSFTNVSSFVVKKNEAVTGNRSVIRMRPNGVAGTVEGFSHEQIGGGAAYNPNTLFDANGNAIGNPSGQGASVVVQELSTLLFEQSQILAYRDGSLDQTINNVVSGTVPIGTCSVNQPLWIGYNFDSNDRAFDGKFQEIILFTSDQSSNREDIEKNINTHFKIYS